MKFIIPFAVCFLIGVGVGWYVGYAGQNAEKQLIVRGVWTRSEEVIVSAEARSALKAIPIIESADKKQAVAWFAKPIARYYKEFAGEACTNAERLRLRAMIEALASTNSIVAEEIQAKVQ